jgi:hypothetical protein
MAEVSTVRQAPAEFIEAAGKTYLDDLTSAVGGIKGLDVSKLYGQQFVAGPGALQTQAETLAGGLGGYQPYLQAAVNTLEEHKLNKQLQVWLDLKLIKLICLHINKMLLIQV